MLFSSNEKHYALIHRAIYYIFCQTQVLFTCIHRLPSNSERCFGLDDVAEDGAAIVLARPPGELRCAVSDLLDCYTVWSSRGT